MARRTRWHWSVGTEQVCLQHGTVLADYHPTLADIYERLRPTVTEALMDGDSPVSLAIQPKRRACRCARR